tara:strand:- start:516 stop:761 length:246 start_codon:yes stop_codon:yes gene_type:complete
MKNLVILTLIIIGAGLLRAEITPLEKVVPQGKYVPSELGEQAVQEEGSTRKIPENALDFPIRKGVRELTPDSAFLVVGELA